MFDSQPRCHVDYNQKTNIPLFFSPENFVGWRKVALQVAVAVGELIFLKHENFPAGVDEGAAEEEAVHRLVHQPVEHHLPVPGADRHSQLKMAALAQVVVADG